MKKVTKAFLQGLKMKLPMPPTPVYYEPPGKFENMSIGNMQVRPVANIEGGRSVNEIPIYIPTGKTEAIRTKNRASGDIDVNFATPSMVEGQPTVFGMGGSGNFMEGQVDYPQELQVYGAPESQKFGQGLTVDQLRAYLSMPITENTNLNIQGQINPYYIDPVDGTPLGKEKNIGANIEYRF